jgi:FSR family fosmidomycin resistance protein-like MFS transporter
MAFRPESLPLPQAPAAARVRRSGLLVLALLSCGHFFVDLYSSALGVFQPLLVEKLGLSLTQAGVLGGVLVFSSSVTQPLYGFLSDRFRSRLFSALAPAVAGVFISALGMAGTFGWALALVLLGGAGISSLHPQASARATAGIERNRGRWMAVFISSGTLGLALGPVALSAVVTRLGFPGVIWAAIPGVLATFVLLAWLPAEVPASSKRGKGFDWPALRAVWRPMTILYLAVFIRSIVQITFIQFLPLYLHRERGYTLPEAALALTVYLTAGAVGGFVGGHLSDRFGARRVIMASMIGCVPFLAWFFASDGPLAVPALAAGGLVLLFTIPVNVVVAQQLVPSQAGTVSALMMGFAWGTAGVVFIPLVGWVSDQLSLHLALSGLLAFPLAGFLLTRRLPRGI